MIRIRKILLWLNKLDKVVWYGAGKELLKPEKKQSFVVYCLSWVLYRVLSFLDRIDTALWFGKRGVRTEDGRVRSRGEKRLVRLFKKLGLRYVYEKPLVLGKVTMHPDFYLPDYKAYVEFWGMADISRRYRKIMHLKKKKYQEHGICVVSVMPDDMKGLDEKFPILFQEATGKSLT